MIATKRVRVKINMQTKIDVYRDILHIEDPTLGRTKTKMSDFVDVCQNELNLNSIKQKKFVIEQPELSNLHFTTLDKSLLDVSNLSFTISEEDAANIVNQVIKITTNPRTVASLLKEVDTELGHLLEENNIKFTDNDYTPSLIEGSGHCIPGPPPKDYHLKKKRELLSTLLENREQKNEINKEGTPKFRGFVDPEEANPFVASGHVFTEEKQVSRLLLHGSLTHRLMFDALCCAIKNGTLDLHYKDENKDVQELTPQQLLEMLVYVNYYQRFQNKVLNKNPYSLWTLTIDTVIDTTSNRESHNPDYLNPDLYNFSCRSPFVLNSLLLCFGKELDLPNLQHYLLDSHWKAAYEMVNRVKNALPSKNVPDSRIYIYCMAALSTATDDPGNVVVSFPFTLDESKAQANPKFEPYDSKLSASIAKKTKKSLPTEEREYASWHEFYAKKQKSATSGIVLHEKTQPPSPEKSQPSVTRKNCPYVNIQDYSVTLVQLVKDKEQGNVIDRFIENDVLDKFTEQAIFISYLLKPLKLLEPASQLKLLELLGKERLIKIIGIQMDEILQALSTAERQAYLINLLGSEFLQKSTKTYFGLVKTLCLLQAESRIALLQQLNKDFIVKLFPLVTFLVDAIERLQKENMNDAVSDLLKVLGNEPMLCIMQSQMDNNKSVIYHRFEPWQGLYNAKTWAEYFGELENLMKSGFHHVLLISSVDSLTSKTVSITYSSSDGWSVIDPNLPHPFAISSNDTVEVAKQVFTAFVAEGTINLSTQFCIEKSFLENKYYNLPEKQKAITDMQVLNILSALKPTELNTIKPTLMQKAFKSNNKDLCEKLIHNGVDFYSCNVDLIAFNDELFNSLCETQAEYNIKKVKAEIFEKDWGLILGGKIISDLHHPEGVKVPKTVELEWQEVKAAQMGIRSYYLAWKNIIGLRKEAAKHNKDFLKFLRGDPAKEHYDDANKIKTLSLKK